MNFLMKNKSKAPTVFSEYHFLFVERPFGEITEDISLWGWSPWWPKRSALRYSWSSDEAAAGLQVGTHCQLTFEAGFKGVLAAKIVLKGEVAKVRPKRLLQINWRSEWIEGTETINIEERSNGTRVDHRFKYVCQHFIKRLAWMLFFRAHYQEGIKNVLDSLGQQLKVPDRDDPERRA